MGDPASADALVSNALHLALSDLTKQGLNGPDIRERNDFDPSVREALSRPGCEPAGAKKLVAEDFPGIGAVDIVVSDPPILLELKWSYDESRSKIFEGVWDAIKLALLAGANQHWAYLATGASYVAWGESECADLFEKEFVRPRELWDRPLIPPGPNNGTTVGEDLVRGSPSSSRPLAAPERLWIRPIDRIGVRGGYEVRVVRVAADGPIRPW